jgi:poly-gamma-glutamate capsule biosynthesis protein CapA/YwtB (metallophosphatase superfamily)
MTTERQTIRVFLCGDVMIGRGVDQIMAHPSDARLHEPLITSATDYVYLAEAANGGIPRHVSESYIWGDAIDVWAKRQPDLRIINLETSITRSSSYAPKGINYRMSPKNADCLLAAQIDCCALANNHVLDWGRSGLLDTLDRLAQLGIKAIGAGCNAKKAAAPAVFDFDGNARVLVFSFASVTSGVPRSWAAGSNAPGVNLLLDLSEASAWLVAEEIRALKRPGDIVVVSIHWGENWGYEIPYEQRQFAHILIDEAGISILHGHSSHHAKGIEVYRGRLILYGCGDFINDYEGIEGHQSFRDDLSIMYFADIGCGSGDLCALEMVPLQIRKFCLQPASSQDIEWLARTLDRESGRVGTWIEVTVDGGLELSW